MISCALYFRKKCRCIEKIFESIEKMYSYIEKYHGIIKDIFADENIENKYIVEYEDKKLQRIRYMVFYHDIEV